MKPDSVTKRELSVPFRGPIGDELFIELAPEIQNRLVRLDEIPALIDWIVGDAPEPDPADWQKVMTKAGVADVLAAVIVGMADCEWTSSSLEALVLGVGAELDAKSQLPVRLAVTGRRAGLPLFQPLAALARSVVIGRLQAARSRV